MTRFIIFILAGCRLVSIIAARQMGSEEMEFPFGFGGGSAPARCETQSICFASSNRPLELAATPEESFKQFALKCLEVNPDTDVLALSFQDFPGGEIPKYLRGLPVRAGGERFKLRHQFVMQKDGVGKACYTKFDGGMVMGGLAGAGLGAKIGAVATFKLAGLGAIPGAIIGGLSGMAIGSRVATASGIQCGGSAVIIYSLKKIEVLFEGDDNFATTVAMPKTLKDRFFEAGDHITATTHKGSMAANFNINGRNVVIASTHGTEGVRGKKLGSPCGAGVPTDSEKHAKSYEKAVRLEQLRVNDFRTARDMINTLRDVHPEPSAALWGGDFNHRSVDPLTGCARHPQAPDGSGFQGALEQDEEAALAWLEEGRDVLGDNPDAPGLTTFSDELTGTDFVEALKNEGGRPSAGCPTYKKGEQKIAEGLEQSEQFSCMEDGHINFYKVGWPPSWTDRIYFTSGLDWLQCSPLQKLVREDDHDSVLVNCVISSPSCDNLEDTGKHAVVD
jgi:hypothetical protein